MSKENPSAKHTQINKANSRMVAIIAGASAIVVFSLVASRALISQRSFQSRVISEKTKAVKQLKENIDTANKIVTSYNAFVGAPENVLGGNPSGTGERDGDNARIVLDALPSKYDFPALASSLEKLLSTNYVINSITGTDDELQQQNTSSPTPAPVEMPFQIAVSGNYGSIQNLMLTLEKSIRPIQVQSIQFAGNDQSMQVTLSAKTFYQPEKNLSITTKEIK